MNNDMKQKKGFTLIELMVVIVIIGILVTIGTFAFQSSQKKSRDSRRKGDLSQVSKALEMYNTDIGVYPDYERDNSANPGEIIGCGDTIKTACSWGGLFSNTTKVIYMVKLPMEPMSNRTKYYYERVGTNGYRLYARLENLEDSSIPTADPKVYNKNCGSSSVVCCNFVLTSSNVSEPIPQNCQ